MSYFSREDFLKAATTRDEKDVSFRGREVRIRELSAKQRFAIAEAASDEEGKIDTHVWRVLAVREGVIDPETGGPLLSGDDITQLIADATTDVVRLGDAILAFSGATPEGLFRGDQADDAAGEVAGAGADDSEPDEGRPN